MQNKFIDEASTNMTAEYFLSVCENFKNFEDCISGEIKKNCWDLETFENDFGLFAGDSYRVFDILDTWMPETCGNYSVERAEQLSCWMSNNHAISEKCGGSDYCFDDP